MATTGFCCDKKNQKMSYKNQLLRSSATKDRQFTEMEAHSIDRRQGLGDSHIWEEVVVQALGMPGTFTEILV